MAPILPGKIIRQGSALAKQAKWRPQAGAPLLMIFARRRIACRERTARLALAGAVTELHAEGRTSGGRTDALGCTFGCTKAIPAPACGSGIGSDLGAGERIRTADLPFTRSTA